MSSYLSLTPAYGRDYKSAKEVKEAWNANKDFGSLFGYVNKQQVDELKARGVTAVNIRYKKLTAVCVIKL